MEEDEKQKLESLRKQLEEIEAEIEKVLAILKQGIFLDVDKAKRQGEILRELRRKEREIIRQIQNITKGKNENPKA
jgi:vacuolar-type H+-ATPase subunit I/STV1